MPSISWYSVVIPTLCEPERIELLSNLLNSVYRLHILRLAITITAQEADLILITGNLLNLKQESTDDARG